MPTSPRCRCHACRPESLTDPHDRKCVQDVLRHGVHVVAVGTGLCDCSDGDCSADGEGPAFAYTVGLPHHADHPELVVSGLRPELMHCMLNNAAQRVLRGFRFEPGTTAEDLISSWPVIADPLSPQGLDETVLWSRWFHRRPVEALQLVWPSTRGIFSWQPGSSRDAAAAQPAQWRLPQDRVGALAADPPWPFPVPSDHIAAACAHIVEEGAPVSSVARLADEGRGEDWLFLCELAGHDETAIRGSHLAHLVRSAPSLHLLADLGPDEQADRETCWSPWVRRKVA